MRTYPTFKLNDLIVSSTANPTAQAPGLVFRVVNGDGAVLASTASGVRSLSSQEPMTDDTVFWIASCTKMVSAIALMQLVEQGKADLDSADLLESYVPEMKSIQVLEKGKLREKTNRITLRMLMTHTSGLAYSFFSYELWETHFKKDASKDELRGTFTSIKTPLIFEPGTDRAYGCGIDWALIFLERLTGLTLGQYMAKYIFEPLNLTSTGFDLTPSMRSRLAGAHRRSYETNQLSSCDHIRYVEEGDFPDRFDSGGGGLFSTALEYAEIVATILNDGVCATTGKQILRKETIDLMFQNQIPDWMERHAERGYPIPRPDVTQSYLEKAIPVTEPQGWGLNFQLFGDKRQEGKTEAGVQFYRAMAPGLMNCFWGLDREKGVGAVLLSQILPFADPVVFPLWLQLQEVMYKEETT